MSANNNNDKFSQSKNESMKSNLFRTDIYVLIINYKQVIAFSHQVLAGVRLSSGSIKPGFPMCPILRTIDIYEVYVMNTRRIYACIVSVLDLLFIVPKNMSCEFIETVDDKSIP